MSGTTTLVSKLSDLIDRQASVTVTERDPIYIGIGMAREILAILKREDARANCVLCGGAGVAGRRWRR